MIGQQCANHLNPETPSTRRAAALRSSHEGGMDEHRVTQSILFRLIEQKFGGLARILDVPCARDGIRSSWHAPAPSLGRLILTTLNLCRLASSNCVPRMNSKEECGSNIKILSKYQPATPFDLIYCARLICHLRDPIGGAEQLRAHRVAL